MALKWLPARCWARAKSVNVDTTSSLVSKIRTCVLGDSLISLEFIGNPGFSSGRRGRQGHGAMGGLVRPATFEQSRQQDACANRQAGEGERLGKHHRLADERAILQGVLGLALVLLPFHYDVAGQFHAQ